MQILNRNRKQKLIDLWIYMPGILIIAMGSCILLFPRFLPAVLAAFFILSGLLLIQVARRLRVVATHMRKHRQLQGEESLGQIPYGLLPRRVYMSWIN